MDYHRQNIQENLDNKVAQGLIMNIAWRLILFKFQQNDFYTKRHNKPLLND